jgi:hypothetical protein
LKARPNSKEPKLEIITNLLLTIDFNVFQKKKNQKYGSNFGSGFGFLIFNFDSRIGSKN